MRIAYITYEYPPDISAGGIATYVFEAARMMQAQGVEVEVFAGSHHRSGVFEEDGIVVHRVQVPDVDAFAAAIAKCFIERHRQMPFDLYETPEINANAAVIHEQLPALPFVTKLHMPVALQLQLFHHYVPFLSRVRYVLGALRRGRWDAGYWRTYDPHPEQDRDYRMTIAASAITAPSEAMKQWACRYWRLDPDRITVVENPYTPSELFLQQTYDYDNRPYLCFIGKLNVHKGMVAFTKALPGILNNNPSLKVMLIGHDGPSPLPGIGMRSYMEQRLRGFEDRIVFAGKIPPSDLPRYLQQARACIFPSIWEAFGYVALEAMSAGVPVLVSKGSGLEEVVDHGRFGVLFDPLQPDDMIKAVTQVLQNRSRCYKLSALGRERVLFYGRDAALANKHLQFYQATISKSV